MVIQTLACPLPGHALYIEPTSRFPIPLRDPISGERLGALRLEDGQAPITPALVDATPWLLIPLPQRYGLEKLVGLPILGPDSWRASWDHDKVEVTVTLEGAQRPIEGDRDWDRLLAWIASI